MMNKQQLGLVALIKSAITQKCCEIPEGFDVRKASEVAKAHEIVPVFCEGLRICSVSLSAELSSELFDLCCKAILQSEFQQSEIATLLREFDNHNIDYMPLKGTVLKKIYPKAEFRHMGDADILIRENQYSYIETVLLDLGFEFAYETDHEIVWKKKTLILELHKKLIPERNEDFYEYFSDSWNMAVKDGNKCNSFKLSNENMILYIFTHFAKHYRGGGIGINHILDLWILKSKIDYDEKYVHSKLKTIGLDEFYKNISDLIDSWFSSAEVTEKTDFITDVIFAGGVYGSYDARVLSRQLVREKHGNKNKYSSKLLHALFPPVKSLNTKYPILKKYIFLLPVIWAIRIVNTLFFNRKKISVTSSNLKKASGQNVETYRKSLNYVGLDFNFGSK